MSIGIYFGIDTSNYTTSAAAVTVAGEVFCAKRLLSVPEGARGMRQSDALFCHTRDLSEIIGQVLEQVREKHGSWKLLGVAASDKPRPVEGSYMPCFLAGVSAASSAAAMADVPLRLFSHQEGHIEAARFGAFCEGRGFEDKDFYAFHLSGGTTEFLRVRETESGYRAELLAEALDLTCGQLIDRCGVKLGLAFPAGRELELLAKQSRKHYKVRIPKKEGGINLSGFENRFDGMLAEGESPEDLARFVFDVTREAIRTLLEFKEGEGKVLFSGGVTSAVLLQEALADENHFFAPPAYTADNAIGTALLCAKGDRNG
ncbi:MAG: peptidase M22 [Ruminococcaceae bacterium]|nr:peptidase M22 [Oscillospiraceae bacterium]